LISKQFYRVIKNEVLWKGNIKEMIKFTGSYYESFKFNYGLKRVKDGIKYDKSIKELYEEKEIYPPIGHITIHSQIELLQNVITLNLNQNKLTYIPSNLGNLINLKKLYLSSNQLTSCPSELGNLTNLESLHLDNNQLTHIPSEFGNLKKLKSKHHNNHTLIYN
jgi:Leucine-rich repeat (LRR) protein